MEEIPLSLWLWLWRGLDVDSCSVQLGGAVFLSGGHGPGYPGQFVYDSLVQYEVQTESWLTLTAMPVDRYGHGCAENGGEIFVSGGYSYSQDRLGRVDVFSPLTAAWRQLADLNVPRNNHRMVFLNNIRGFPISCSIITVQLVMNNRPS